MHRGVEKVLIAINRLIQRNCVAGGVSGGDQSKHRDAVEITGSVKGGRHVMEVKGKKGVEFQVRESQRIICIFK